MNPNDTTAMSSPKGLKARLAEKPWIMLVAYMCIFVGLSIASLVIALANPPQGIGG